MHQSDAAPAKAIVQSQEMRTVKLPRWVWYLAAVFCIGVALWTINYILFLAMESARTYANLPVIEERYHQMLVVLAVSVVGAIVCFFKGRKNG